MFEEYFEKRRIKKNFLMEHKKYLPNYTKTGQKLDWDIFIYKDGDFDTFTGEQSGEYRISVEQKSPLQIIDDCVYKYNIDTKEIEIIHGARWM